MKGTWILIWRGHIFQRDNLVSAETRIFKKFFQRLCQNLKLLGSFIPNGFHVSQYPQQPGQMKQRIQHLLRGSVPSSTLEICSRASSWPSEPRVQCENAGISLCICFGLLWETVMSKLPGSEQDSCCKLFAKAPLPSVGARFFPPQTVCTRTKNKNYCQINSSSPKTMAGGKILGHWVPAKTCHFSPHSGRGSGNLLWVRVRGWQQRATVAWASCLVLRELVNSWKEGRGFCSATHFQILLLALGWRISHGTEFTFIHLNTQMFIDFLLSVRLDARLWKEISTFNSVFSIGGLIGKISLSVFTEL